MLTIEVWHANIIIKILPHGAFIPRTISRCIKKHLKNGGAAHTR